MDLNHDYNGNNELLLAGSSERLQMCKCAILAYGDLGYTDPPIPDIRDAIGMYTDSEGIDDLRNKIYEILIISQVVTEDEIISIDIISEPNDNIAVVDLQLSFGSDRFSLPSTLIGV